MYKINSFIGVIIEHEDRPDLAYILKIGQHWKIELKDGTVYDKIYFSHAKISGTLIFYPEITSTDSIWINVNDIVNLKLVETA